MGGVGGVGGVGGAAGRSWARGSLRRAGGRGRGMGEGVTGIGGSGGRPRRCGGGGVAGGGRPSGSGGRGKGGGRAGECVWVWLEAAGGDGSWWHGGCSSGQGAFPLVVCNAFGLFAVHALGSAFWGQAGRVQCRWSVVVGASSGEVALDIVPGSSRA